ncbi:uncharacterized protein LOC121249331 [Juglans microcarpa x Juglans regia]|uniref:uncharacterized protein LOC121249331 n=1 Tax=Juglans microcarpa x Juglans regia TaxID=2249226 RepID=UPI001B7EAB67|nr:uncharacterized protein LOC121249331 [Juglans microcarpa x Juglans regia]
MDMYDGTRDPLEHLEIFRVDMTLHGFSGEMACRAFPLTLRGLARVWLGFLALGSIDGFGKLARLFLTQFMASQIRRWLEAYLFTIKQGENESLKTYLSRFNKEQMTIEDQDEKITLVKLLGGVWPQSQFKAELAKRTPTTLR